MLGIKLVRSYELSLVRQLYNQLKKLIMQGQLNANEKLPSTRVLAKALNVSRNTVVEAYDMLFTEGFIILKQGAPTTVVEQVSIKQQAVVKKIIDNNKPFKIDFLADFKTGQGDLKLFSIHLWQQMLVKGSQQLTKHQLGYLSPQGVSWLRSEIAAWLFRSRGLQVADTDIFITTGSTQALNILADLLNKKVHSFVVEDPCHIGVLNIIKNKQYPYTGCVVDEQGIQPELLTHKAISAVYVTPSHQFPLGGILPAKRRVQLISLARKKDFYIIEDDYDSEFRYQGAVISPLYSMDAERVIYLGTFSKSLFPALRIGFVILPKALQPQWLHFRQYMDVQNNSFEQAALAEFLQSRRMDKHIQKMSKIYGERRAFLLNCLKQTFGSDVAILGDNAGLHLVVQIQGKKFRDDFTQQAASKGIRIATVNDYSLEKAPYTDKLLLGYGHLTPEQINHHIKLLYDFIKTYKTS